MAPFITRSNLFILVSGIWLLLGVALSIFGYIYLKGLGVFEIRKESLEKVISFIPRDNTKVYDKNGKKIGEFFSNYHTYVPFEKIPKSMIQAITAIEDRNFWTHDGIDYKAILRATIHNLRHPKQIQGASTITQQLVRNFYLSREKTIDRKVKEIFLARALENNLSKEKILEIYSNHLFLGFGSYGVGAAAWRYFGKPLQELETHEVALIAGLFQSPSFYNPNKNPNRAKMRQLEVLRAMYEVGHINKEQARALARKPLVYHEYKSITQEVAPYFVDHVRELAAKKLQVSAEDLENQGYRIYTTLDSDIQTIAEEAVANSNRALENAALKNRKRTTKKDYFKPDIQAAALVIDTENGHIAAMIGGRNYKESNFNRATQALRQPGSLFKPIVYSLALMEGWKWNDLILISPISVANYRPRNYDDENFAETTLLQAFYKSYNTPAVELGEKLGLKKVLEHARLLGIETPLKEEFGTILGSSEVTMFDIARVYMTYANMGKKRPVVGITKITDREGKILFEEAPADAGEQVIPPQIAFLMTKGMQAVLAHGTAYQSHHLAPFAAGKTGTTNNATDNWFCGFSDKYLTLVWVGTEEHRPLQGNFTGSRLALPIWDEIMGKIVDKSVAKDSGPTFPPPENIVDVVVHPQYGYRYDKGMRMYFLKSNQPSQDSQAQESFSKIRETENFRNIFRDR